MLFLSTDGIEEAEDPNGTRFGLERVIQYFAFQRHPSARQIIDGLYEKVRTHSNHMAQQDDITAVILKTL
jgi:serine phosphatase RsbU (regulator of sigma subunit)